MNADSTNIPIAMATSSTANYLIAILVILGLLTFLYGVGYACVKSWPKKNSSTPGIPEYISLTLTNIATILGTNVGGVIGITIAKPGTNYNKAVFWNPSMLISDPNPTSLQVIACYVYIIALLATLVVLVHQNFDKGKVVPVVYDLSKSFLGMILGAMAVAFGASMQK